MATLTAVAECDGKRGGAFGECSTDMQTIYHGMEGPAKACGRHVEYDFQKVCQGHRIREGRA